MQCSKAVDGKATETFSVGKHCGRSGGASLRYRTNPKEQRFMTHASVHANERAYILAGCETSSHLEHIGHAHLACIHVQVLRAQHTNSTEQIQHACHNSGTRQMTQHALYL